MKRTTEFYRIGSAMLSLLVGSAQTGPSVDELLRRLAKDDSAAEAAGGLSRHADDSRAVPALRSRFLTADAKFTKQSIAVSLLKMNVDEPIYFNYLASFALEAIKDDAPLPYLLNGREPDYQNLNPEFVKWCRDHGTTVGEESSKERFDRPRDVLLLASARDRRSAPILRKGLLSKNPVVVIYCASGLGALQDRSDIDLIIEAAYKSRVDVDAGVAMSLSSYRDPRDREEISRRLRGSRLYDEYTLAVRAEDRRNGAAMPK